MEESRVVVSFCHVLCVTLNSLFFFLRFLRKIKQNVLEAACWLELIEAAKLFSPL